MTKNLIYAMMTLFLIAQANSVTCQIYNEDLGCLVEKAGEPCLPNTLSSAVPFLRITPDARAGGMGDAGIATSADPNALHFNASKLAFAENKFGLSATYTPWLKDLGLNDVYLAYLSGYSKLDNNQSLGFGLRFFSLGEIAFTSSGGNPIGTGSPMELELAMAYARKLSSNLSAAMTGKYIRSSLASGVAINSNSIVQAGNGFATDLSLMYRKPIRPGTDITVGMAITNLGTKINYDNDIERDFLPANLGLGIAYISTFEEYHKFTFTADINKLLVPTPIPYQDSENYDKNNNGIADFTERAVLPGAVLSFNDASGGIAEELAEIYYSFGVEYWYDNQFAVRTGYFHESPRKGDRQFITFGIGAKYNVFGMNISYLVSTNERRGTLDNTVRFSMMFDLGNQQKT